MRENTIIQTSDAAATERLGFDIGSRLRGGEVIELISDLGGGKTTFVRGFARGAGSDDHVSSPTFTINKVYKSPKHTIHHYDFYRLHEAGVLEHEIQEILSDPSSVVVVEWGEVVGHILPDKRLRIEIEQLEDEARQFSVSCDPELDYLIQENTA